MRPANHPVIHKFGGAALADSSAIRRSLDLFRAQPQPRILVVSALAGITDRILAILLATGRSTPEASRLCREFAQQHRDTALALGLPASASWWELLAQGESRLLQAVQQADAGGQSSPCQRDALLALGEQLSAALMAALLEQQGEAAVLVPATDLIHTSGPPGDAIPDQAATRRAVQERLPHLLAQGRSPVVPGFIGRGPEGEVLTLGRGGTDLTATLIGRAIDAAMVVLWKDVRGFLTADPRLVPEARVLPEVHRIEAADLAWYGARVLHPRALAPLSGTSIPVQIRPFADPADPGSLITAQRGPDQAPVRALATRGEQSLLTIIGGGVVGVPAIAGRLFQALQQADIPVAMVAQSSAEAAIDCSVSTRHADQAVTVLRKLLQVEIQQGEIDGVERRDGMAIVAVVGLAMAGRPEVTAEILQALAEAGVSPVSLVQSAGERNLSILVEAGDAPAALRRIHSRFQLGRNGGGHPLPPRGRDLVILGAGTIGRSLLQLLAGNPDGCHHLRVITVLDRSGAAVNPEGFTPTRLAQLSQWKAEGRPLRDHPEGVAGDLATLLEELTGRALVRPVLVDLTADQTLPLLQRAAAAGWDLVLANKQPLAGPAVEVTRLQQTLAHQKGILLHEATVGAGLPILTTLRHLLAAGDRIHSLEGCLSGTLGRVLSAVEAGVPFSSAVRSAREEGLTEPDPRVDLSGTDVACKALILARSLGVELELDQIPRDSLVLDQSQLTLAQWLERLPQSDQVWAERVARAGEKGAVLRYVARVTPGEVQVGLRELPLDHPLARLQWTANQLVYRSDYYSDEPLVITGPGAGPRVTAAGVLSDLLALPL